jgi:hypothetical protein
MAAALVLVGPNLGSHRPSEEKHYSLGIYPLIVLGLFLYRRGVVEPGYWASLSGSGALFVSAVHFGSLAVEPPADIIGPYERSIVGWFAFAWLLVFVAVFAVTFLYEVSPWPRRCRRARARCCEVSPPSAFGRSARPSPSCTGTRQPLSAPKRRPDHAAERTLNPFLTEH